MATIVYQGADDIVSEEIDDEHTYIPRERVYTVKMTDPHFENE